MKSALVLARKEFLDVLRERSIVLALMTQLFVAAFSAFITIGLVSLYDPESVRGIPTTQVAYVGPGGFDAYLVEDPFLDVVRGPFDEAVADFDRGEIGAIVEETVANGSDARTLTLLLPEGEPESSLVVAKLKGLLRDYERDLRFERQDRVEQQVLYVETDARPNVYYGFAFGVLVPLLIITPVFLSGAITGDSFSHEIQSQTLALLRSSPISTLSIVLGKMATPLLLVPAQAILWLLLLRANGLDVQNVGALLVLAFVMGLLLASLGVLIAFVARQVGPTQELYTLLVLVLFALGLLLPQDPLNLVARLAAGSQDVVSWLSLGLLAAAAVALFSLALWAADRRLRAESP